MARPGQVIDNPVSGERITFLQTARTTGGELLRMELQLAPRGGVPMEHIHPVQVERFEVLEGRVRFRLGREFRELGPGDHLVSPPRIRHGLWNLSGEEARLTIELRPALNSELLFETFWGLAAWGKVGRNGVPGLLQSAVVASECPDFVYRADLPIGVQKLGIALLAPVGRLLGYRARYGELTEGSEVSGDDA